MSDELIYHLTEREESAISEGNERETDHVQLEASRTAERTRSPVKVCGPSGRCYYRIDEAGQLQHEPEPEPLPVKERVAFGALWRRALAEKLISSEEFLALFEPTNNGRRGPLLVAVRRLAEEAAERGALPEWEETLHGAERALGVRA